MRVFHIKSTINFYKLFVSSMMEVDIFMMMGTQHDSISIAINILNIIIVTCFG